MYVVDVLLPLAVPRRAVARPTGVLGAMASVSLAVAVTARLVTGAVTTPGSSPWTASWSGAHLAAVLDVVAFVGASAAGAGVLLAGAALVAAVRAGHGRRLPVILGTVTLAMTLGAVLAGLAASAHVDDGTAAALGLLRTALAGLAVTCLPALALAALRARARR